MAQSSIKDSVLSCKMISAHYGFYLPFADMKTRFGGSSLVGGELSFKNRHNWYFGVEGDYLFGRKVKDSHFLDSLYTADSLLIGYQGTDGRVALQERGFSFEGKVGKLFPIKKFNPNSGILVTVGAGFLQHKIRIVDVDEMLYQLDGAYAKGYDRLTNGLMISQSVMFINLDPKHYLNFRIGFDCKEAFTQNRRSWNFDERRQDTSKRLDIIIGLRAAWMLPFFGRQEERFYTH